MKRVKDGDGDGDGEKQVVMMEPMFPRLNVNDTEKGWPKAPPRNKMALYERFSVPSQGFNHGSSSHGNGTGRNFQFRPRVSSSKLSCPSEKFHAHQPDVMSVSTSSARNDQRKKLGDQDDFAVPVLVDNLAMAHCHSKTRNGIDWERWNAVKSPASSGSVAKPCEEQHSHKSNKLSDGGACLLQESRNDFLQDDGILSHGAVTLMGNHCGPIALNDDDDASETSMVDCISPSDISSDDIVGALGQKRFFQARTTIAKQQRVFAKQVFQLHRLIKVQRHIAGSPHMLPEDSAYLANPSLNSSPAKKLPSEIIIKPLARVLKRKDDSKKVNNHKMEGYAENAVGRQPPLSSNYETNVGTAPTIVPLPTDPRMDPWYFHQFPGQQQLIPVMSPSEGLIYKPYPGPGFTENSFFGGCGPPIYPAYGFAVPQHQGVAVLPGGPSVHGHFPSYGMPVMKPTFPVQPIEQQNQFSGPGSLSHAGSLSEREASFSCNLPIQRNGTVPRVTKYQPSKVSSQRRSTASSPSERGQQGGNLSKGKDALPLFPLAPTNTDAATLPLDTDMPTKAIRVVPHNPRLATESAARIFHSIQEERKQK